MAAKKFYAVKKGRTTGVFSSWEDCKASVDGYAGAQYKGFSTLAEAKDYLSSIPQAKGLTKPKSTAQAPLAMEELPSPGWLLAYVDGSYEEAMKKYAFGCVFLFPDGRIYTEYGNGDNEQSLQLRNVTGEMLGAMFAVKFAMANRFSGVEIRYDYQGIEKWVTGEWRSKTDLTQKYAKAMREWGKSIMLRFTKVAAHSNVEYNELADCLAKTGLVKGNGVPKVRRAEEMELYNGTDSFE